MTKQENETREKVRRAYASVAVQSESGGAEKSCCCGEKGAYAIADHPVPEAELGVSCGTPVAFSLLKEGDAVLDLGCGGGKDVFLAARSVGKTGRAVGVDMTDQMLTLARRNAVKFKEMTGLENVEFRKGEIESLPVETDSIDVVISNCVINLSPDKSRVFREIHRVLRTGGKMVVSDIVLNRELPDSAKKDEALYAACVAGALLRDDYIQAIRQARFRTVEILSDKNYAIMPVGDLSFQEDYTKSLKDAAASITVMAVK